MAKVLVVDDDAVTRKILFKGLQSMGHSVIMAPNGRNAWETLLDNEDIALLITDMVMPDIDGRQLINHIRSNRRFHDLPILIVSGEVGAEEVSDLLKLETIRFLPKPVDITVAKEHVAELVHLRPVRKIAGG